MLEEKIYGTIAISNRHIHLTEETYNLLFDHHLTIKKELTQEGEYAASETLTIKNEDKEIENVRIVGPLRNYNQVEISKNDARKLGLNPPVRESGDIKGSEAITLVGPKGEVKLTEGCIISKRHIHMNNELAAKLSFKDKQKVKLIIENEKSGEIDAYIKITNNGIFEIHIDTDDANAFLLSNGDKVEIKK